MSVLLLELRGEDVDEINRVHDFIFNVSVFVLI